MSDFDVVVVGAGPAGSAAAIRCARGGLRTLLIERGPFPGSKNVYGGVIYPRILDELLEDWRETVPVQRFVTRRSTMIMTPSQSVSLDVRSGAWGETPYNGITAYRAEFDQWLADAAVEAGATLACSTTVTGLITEGGRVVGVRTDRPDGDLRCALVIACDGVNSFLAKEAGLYENFSRHNMILGVKEVLALGKDEIDARFNLEGREGCDIEMLGATGEITGGGFLYTNLDTLAVGCVLSLDDLAASKRRPEEVLESIKSHPSIAPLVRGGELVEYAAHLIPEGGYDAMPQVAAPGLLVAGDAASLTLAAGVWLEGVNFAIASGAAAGAAATKQGSSPRDAHEHYRGILESDFVLRDHQRLRRAPKVVFSRFAQRDVPGLVCDIAEEFFTVENPEPKPGITRIARRVMKRRGVRLRDAARTGFSTWRLFR